MRSWIRAMVVTVAALGTTASAQAETLADALIACATLHALAALVMGRIERTQLIKAMVTGIKEHHPEAPARAAENTAATTKPTKPSNPSKPSRQTAP